MTKGQWLLLFACVMNADAGSRPAHASSTYVVDRLSDGAAAGEGQGAGLSGDLRYALTNAQSGDTVTFRVAGTIRLAGLLPGLTRNVTVVGPGAKSLTVQGRGGNVISVASGATVVLSGLTVTGGRGNGGGVFNQGTLTLNSVFVTGNVAGDATSGGGTGSGIWNHTGATLTLNGCTVSGNISVGNLSYDPSRGGGIANYGALTLNQSTVSGNSASQGFGGGISNTLSTSTLVLHDSTVSGNSANDGGGIDNHGTLVCRSSVIARNNGGDLSGSLSSLGHNLIGDTDGGSGFRPDLGDLLDVDPLLGPLQDNGGLIRTVAILPGSPALEHGDAAGTPPLDQRGPGYPRIVGGSIDIGAFEAQTLENHPGSVPATLAVSGTDAALTVTWTASCSAGTTDYGVYEGSIGTWYGHAARVCNDSGHDLTETLSPASGNTYYLVVPRNALEEGSYGLGSTGMERPPAAIQCVAPRVLSPCP